MKSFLCYLLLFCWTHHVLPQPTTEKPCVQVALSCYDNADHVSAVVGHNDGDRSISKLLMHDVPQSFNSCVTYSHDMATVQLKVVTNCSMTEANCFRIIDYTIPTAIISHGFVELDVTQSRDNEKQLCFHDGQTKEVRAKRSAVHGSFTPLNCGFRGNDYCLYHSSLDNCCYMNAMRCPLSQCLNACFWKMTFPRMDPYSFPGHQIG